ncbi:TetR/AcrR family transcriptional regulator [Leptothoe sp. PORK10 BA2]|uniref:TetR/AcrR family transcriptional regulator n=1 Tax=Leptothoe sp. PORK10 BA2 TaxID=3110254 RepID=UPI002B2143AD|nr:TetR/AcrR family transcriptional regulator [Leptothoe sp. PORK10 BA2]MEA5464813.1 TetR/AcrR family transcriptional regulator [Leptothoe sp. PORK10 BA2]
MANKPSSKKLERIPLSRERILQCALRLADEDGLESLSMRKLAQALGVKAMSLYNHVTNRDDVIDCMVDCIVSEIEVPKLDADWKEAMRRRAISAHKVLLRHPWATMPLVSRVNVGPAMLQYTDSTLGCLRAAGFSYEMADHVQNAIDSHIYGFTLQALNFPFEPADYAEMAAQFLPQIPESQYPHINQLAQQVIRGDYDGLHRFAFGLDLILDSLDRLEK